MPTTVRSRNLDLIRHLNYGHENTSEKLSSITNASYISKMATGDMVINDDTAESIETALDLPKGWMDRDNLKVLEMPEQVFHLYKSIDNLSTDKQSALLQFLTLDTGKV